MNIRLIVPTHFNPHNGDELGADINPINAYGPAIADIAGGFTAFQAIGGGKDGSGSRVVEPVTVFDCCIPADGYSQHSATKNLDQFRCLARTIARDLHQDCVYLSVDGRVEFVKP